MPTNADLMFIRLSIITSSRSSRFRRIRLQCLLPPRSARSAFASARRSIPSRSRILIAETDILTNGRLECGLGRGHAWLFGPSALQLEESRPRYDEAIDILELAFAH